MDAFDAYGKIAAECQDPIAISGRLHVSSGTAKLIVDDILSKLHPVNSHRLLEIGCGVGVLLTPLAPHFREAIGVDHPSCIQKYSDFGVPTNVRLVAGNWPQTRPQGCFDRILVYSVLQCLGDAASAYDFINECLNVLNPGGALMLGDIPNEDA